MVAAIVNRVRVWWVYWSAVHISPWVCRWRGHRWAPLIWRGDDPGATHICDRCWQVTRDVAAWVADTAPEDRR